MRLIGRSREERNVERTTGRLEAFSDIVIGFALAETGSSLIMPAHAAEFFTHPTALVAFVVTFLIVVRFWLFNNDIFERFFVANRLMMRCVFVALAGLILQVFSLQVYLHFVPLGEGLTASRIYFASFALGYGMQGVMLAIGLAYRWRTLALATRRNGLRTLLTRTGFVAGCIVGDLSIPLAIGTARVGGSTATGQIVPAAIGKDALLGIALGLAAFIVARYTVPGLRGVAESGGRSRPSV